MDNQNCPWDNHLFSLNLNTGTKYYCKTIDFPNTFKIRKTTAAASYCLALQWLECTHSGQTVPKAVCSNVNILWARWFYSYLVEDIHVIYWQPCSDMPFLGHPVSLDIPLVHQAISGTTYISRQALLLKKTFMEHPISLYMPNRPYTITDLAIFDTTLTTAL